MGFLRRLLGRPGEDERGEADASLLADPLAAPSAPVIIRQTPDPLPERLTEGDAYSSEPATDADPGSARQPSDDVEPMDTDTPDADAQDAGTPDDDVAALPEPLPVMQPVSSDVRCPSCAVALDPPPERTRRCPYCREQVIVRRVDGRPVYLTEAALAVFERERQRTADEIAWTAHRQHWLKLAGNVRVPAVRRARLAAAPLTAAAVDASRSLYLSGVELAVRSARNEKRWQDVARMRREQAAALWTEAGSKVPPPAEVVDLHEEGMLAELRSMTRSSRDAELVSAGCCKTCRADDGKAFRIAAELKVPRLPHAGCPKGICKCEWWPTMSDPTPKVRRRKPAQTEEPVAEEPMTATSTASDGAATTADASDVSVVIEVTEPNR